MGSVQERKIVGTCKDCVHWKKGPSDFQSSLDVEKIEKDEIGVCQRLTGLASGKATVAWCGCCGDADLVTRQDFGCVQFEGQVTLFKRGT